MSENQPTSVILFDAAVAYANEAADTSIRADLRMAFVEGAEWQWGRVETDVSAKDAEIAALQKGLTEWQDDCAKLAAEATRLRKGLVGLRGYFLSHGWDEGSVMIDGIDAALQPTSGGEADV